MADPGFQITENLHHHYCTLSIPPGARLHLSARKQRKFPNFEFTLSVNKDIQDFEKYDHFDNVTPCR